GVRRASRLASDVPKRSTRTPDARTSDRAQIVRSQALCPLSECVNAIAFRGQIRADYRRKQAPNRDERTRPEPCSKARDDRIIFDPRRSSHQAMDLCATPHNCRCPARSALLQDTDRAFTRTERGCLSLSAYDGQLQANDARCRPPQSSHRSPRLRRSLRAGVDAREGSHYRQGGRSRASTPSNTTE